MSMKPGKYWIGDLCYALDSDQWDDVCNITINGRECLSGEFKLSDGTPFAMYGTAYGDGCYPDEDGRGYPVDSGSIGCVPLEHLEGVPHGGHVIDFPREFQTSYRDGVIQIGHIKIHTEDNSGWEIDEDEEEE